ncbi:MAG: TIM barrel protein [Paracoccaceae bacterium]
MVLADLRPCGPREAGHADSASATSSSPRTGSRSRRNASGPRRWVIGGWSLRPARCRRVRTRCRGPSGGRCAKRSKRPACGSPGCTGCCRPIRGSRSSTPRLMRKRRRCSEGSSTVAPRWAATCWSTARRLAPAAGRHEPRSRPRHGRGFLRAGGRTGRGGGVAYCIEPLSPVETTLAGTLAEAVALVERVGNPAFRTMIDSSAAAQVEALPVADLIRAHVPTGQIAHVQAQRKQSRRAGDGHDPFGEIVRALIDVGWDRPVAIEPFRTCIDGTVTAAIGYATIRAHEARP